MANMKIFQSRFINALKQVRNYLLPGWVRNSILFRLVQNWTFQGFACAHWTEILFRTCLELALVVGLASILLIWTHYAVMWSVLVVHTLMWTLNGHFWALKISEKRRMVRNTPERIRRYIFSIECRANKSESINACVLSGSLTCGRYHQYSDMDIWFTKKKGLINGLCAYILGVRERSIAFFQRIPIELYFYDPDCVDKNANEKLILLKDVEDRWKKSEHDTVTIEDFPLNEMPFFNAQGD